MAYCWTELISDRAALSCTSVSRYSSHLSIVQTPLPEALEHALPSRRGDFIAGRVSAERALSALSSKSTSVPQQRDGRPRWPEGYYGSITHSSGLALALVVRAEAARVGIDLEEVLDPTQAKDLSVLIADSSEIQICTQQGKYEKNQYLSIIFSCKESIFKALAPHESGHMGFLDCSKLIAIYDTIFIFMVQSILGKKFELDVHAELLDAHNCVFTACCSDTALAKAACSCVKRREGPSD